MVMPPAAGFPPTLPRTGNAIAQRYYEAFAYDPDFLITYQPGFRSVAGAAANYFAARSDAAGIGEAPFDRTPLFGSPGGLRGVVVVGGGGNLQGEGLLVHEIGHNWFVRLDPTLGLSSSDGAHWSGLDRPFSAFGDGRNNDFELYLMGLLPPDSVQPAQIGTNGLTLQDVIARHGARTPSWPDAASAFTAATVVVAERLLTPEELAVYDFLAAEFGRESADPRRGPDRTTFFGATGGRARLETRIPDGAAR
jgi:hypothetical protein